MRCINRLQSVFKSPFIPTPKKQIQTKQIFNTISIHLRSYSGDKSSFKQDQTYIKQPYPETWYAFRERVKDEIDRFIYYNESKVFAPHDSDIRHGINCWSLQLPSKTRVDAIDFLNGAIFAANLACEIIASKEFKQHAISGVHSPIINKAKEIFDLVSYYHLRNIMQIREKNYPGQTIEYQDFQINDLYIAYVSYRNLPLADHKHNRLRSWNSAKELYKLLKKQAEVPIIQQLMDEDKELWTELEEKSKIEETDHITEYEHMSITVQGSLRAKRIMKNEVNEEEMSEWINSPLKLTLGSNVTSPDVVDWKMLDIVFNGYEFDKYLREEAFK